MSKNFCILCKYNLEYNTDNCDKIVDTRKFNLYNGQVISGESFYIQKKSNFEGKCKYYQPKKQRYAFWK